MFSAFHIALVILATTYSELMMASISDKYPSLKKTELLDDEDIVEVRSLSTSRRDVFIVAALRCSELTLISRTTVVKSDFLTQSKRGQILIL